MESGQASQQSEKVKFFDPHFHLYDGTDENNPHKHHTQLENVTFLAKQHEELITGHGDPVELIGGCWVEACCPPEMKFEEAKWVDKQLDKSSLQFGMVSGVEMQSDITEAINLNKTLPRWRGFRQVLNYDDEI